MEEARENQFEAENGEFLLEKSAFTYIVFLLKSVPEIVFGRRF